MMRPDEILEAASTCWLRARERLYLEDGIDVVEEFAEAENALLAAFATGWTGNETVLVTAYQQFRVLLRELGGGACQPDESC